MSCHKFSTKEKNKNSSNKKFAEMIIKVKKECDTTKLQSAQGNYRSPLKTKA